MNGAHTDIAQSHRVYGINYGKENVPLWLTWTGVIIVSGTKTLVERIQI